MEERLQKVLAKRGVASRRGAEQLIRDGRVTVNGQLATIGIKVNAAYDEIEVDGKHLDPDTPDAIYILLNKPDGVVSTCHDPQRRTTVLDILPEALTQNTGLHPIGRLDANSTGALLLTNDGDLTYLLSHPRHHVAKTYRVRVAGIPTKTTLHRWRSGVMLDGQRTLPARVTLLRAVDRTTAELEIVLTEGRNRQIRRVADLLDHPVRSLHRLAIGTLTLAKVSTNPQSSQTLERGAYRHLTSREVRDLRRVAERTPQKKSF